MQLYQQRLEAEYLARVKVPFAYDLTFVGRTLQPNTSNKCNINCGSLNGMKTGMELSVSSYACPICLPVSLHLMSEV